MPTATKTDTLASQPSGKRRRDKALYLVLADEIRHQIRTGSLRPGDRLPSFASVRASRGIAQGTLEKAHGLLEMEGLVQRRQGSGVFVARKRAAASPEGRDNSDRFLGQVIAILTLDEVAPPASHSNDGWREHITQGAMKAAQDRTFHTLTLNPIRIMEEGVSKLIQAAPMGLLASDVNTVRSTNVEIWSAVNGFLKSIRDAGIPIVAYGNASESGEMDRVTPDHEEGAYLETRWLIAQGRKRIAMVWYEPCDEYWYPERRRGYERAMLESGLEPIETIRIPMHTFVQATPIGFEQTVRYLAGYLAGRLLRQDRLDAVMAWSDGDAFQVAGAIRVLGLEPNQDVLVAGYDAYWDEVPEREWEPSVPVVTVDKRNVVAGEEMVHLLMDRIEGNLPAEAQCRKIRPDLIVTANDNL